MARKIVTLYVHDWALRIEQQSVQEVFDTLNSISEEWKIYLTDRYMEFIPEDPNYVDLGFIHLPVIYGVSVTNEFFGMLCRNGILYLYNRKSRKTEIVFPQPTFGILEKIDVWCRVIGLRMKNKLIRLFQTLAHLFSYKIGFSK